MNNVWQGGGRRIHIQEVGTRDGLQMEAQFVPTEDKIALVDQLSATGVAKIEVTSFTSPKAIPALRDAEIVMREIRRAPGVVYTALVPNVRGVTNDVQVAGHSSLTSRSNDTLITSKVKARMIDSASVQANQIKVVTEASTVYLMGMVTQQEADAATQVARTTDGVKKVVRVFEYINDAEARRLDLLRNN